MSTLSELIAIKRSGPETTRRERAMAHLRVLVAGKGLFGRFGYLLATQIALMLFGSGYWVLTTHTLAARQVGIAAAGVALATLLSSVGLLGISSLLLVELNTTSRSEVRLVLTTGLAVTCFVTGTLALGAWAISGSLGSSVRALGADPVAAGLFVLGAMGTSAGLVVDATAIGIRRSPAQLVRNVTQAVLRLFLVALAFELGVRTATGLLAAWVGSLVVSFMICPIILPLDRPDPGAGGFGARMALVRRLGGLSLRHHVLNLAITSVSFFLPVIAALIVVPSELAYFAVAQLVAATVMLPPALLAMSLFAEASGDDGVLRKNIRRSLPFALGCVLLVLAVVEPAAPFVLRLFGRFYEEHGVATLRLLMLGGVPYVIKDHYVSIRRAQRRLTEAARFVAVSTVLEAGGAALGGALFGLTGLCAGWATVAYCETLFFLPAVLNVVRRQPERGNMTSPAAFEL